MGQDFLISEVNELIRGGPDVELNGQIDDVDAEIVSSRARIEDLESDIERAELELDQIKKTQPLWWITHLFKVLGLESDIDDWDEEISGERSAIRSLQEIRADLFELAHPFETEIVGGELEAKLNKKETKVKVRGKLRLRATNPDTGETVEGVYRIESKGPREPR